MPPHFAEINVFIYEKVILLRWGYASGIIWEMDLDNVKIWPERKTAYFWV